MNLRELWEQFKAALEPLLERRVVESDSWDGAPARWPDTDAYCAACLIDVNAAAERTEKAQSHCMLPVRNPGDSADTYVMPAVFAAAGGRGIGRVQRPDDVPATAWAAAMQAAARKLIAAYGQMDRDAPLALYQLANLEPPAREQRARGGRVVITRAADGRFRWAGVACTAFLNRSGEIDSTALFDDFVQQFRHNPAVLDFFHVGGTRLGSVDLLAREGTALLAGGTVDDTPLARAVAQRLSADSAGWGLSVAYQPTVRPDWLDAGESVIPIYRAGILRAVSLLPEASAAALFTEIGAVGGATMRSEVKQALVDLVGQEMAEETERRVDGINERAADPESGLVFRQVDPETVAGLVEQVNALRATVEQLVQQLTGVGETMEEMKTDTAERGKRLAALEARAAEEDKRRAAELPVLPPVPAFRPSATEAPVADAPRQPDLSVFSKWK